MHPQIFIILTAQVKINAVLTGSDHFPVIPGNDAERRTGFFRCPQDRAVSLFRLVKKDRRASFSEDPRFLRGYLPECSSQDRSVIEADPRDDRHHFIRQRIRRVQSSAQPGLHDQEFRLFG